MPEPGESVEPLATRLIDATFCHVVELFATTGSVGSICVGSLSEEPETIEDVHEPYLMQIGFMARTARGRVVTELAYEHLGIEPPQGQARLL